jgi:diamine N-acetyltransferase
LVPASRWTLAPSKPVPSVTVQRASLADVDALAKVAKATFALACPPGTTEENIRSFIEQNLSAEALTDYLHSGRHRLWLAKKDDDPVGYALSIHEDPAAHKIGDTVVVTPTVELSKIYVVENEHGAGVATLLLEEVVVEATLSSARSVWLGVNQFNARANRFYEKHGFELCGTRQFQVGERLEEDFVRQKLLHP